MVYKALTLSVKAVGIATLFIVIVPFYVSAQQAPPASATTDEPDESEGETAEPEGDNEDSDDSQGESLADATGDLLKYIRTLDYNPRKILAVQDEGTVKVEDKIIGEPEEVKNEDDSGKITTCTRTKHTLTGNTDGVAIVQPTKGIIYPGALILIDSKMLDGHPNPVPDLKRGSLTLRIDLPGLGEEGNMKIENPTLGNVETAINKTLNDWMESNDSPDSYKNASRSNFQVSEAFSSDQLAVSMFAKVGYMAFSASASFGMSNSAEKRTISAIYKQIFYTVSFDQPNGFTPDQWFAPGTTVAQASSAFNNETPLGYVQSVDYGRLLMFNMETSKSVSGTEAKAALEAQFGAVSVGGGAETKHAKIIENSKITVITLGGNASVSSKANSVTGASGLKEIIEGENAIFSKSNPGVPIGYTIKFAKDNHTALLGKVTDYTAEECKSFENRWIRVQNGGAFAVGEFVLTYDVGKKDHLCKDREREPPEGSNQDLIDAWKEKMKAFEAECEKKKKSSPTYVPDVVVKSSGGGEVKWEIPGNATNVKLVGNVVAGHQRIKFLDNPNEDFNKCYVTTGTTFSSSEFERRIPGQDGCK